MATITLGTAATTTLTALTFASAGIASADIATLAQSITDDLGNAHATWPEAFSLKGLLYVPNRGVLKMLPGDIVGVDADGWPILVSKRSAASASWSHT